MIINDSFEYLYVMSPRPLEIFSIFQRGDRLYTSESDVYRRQILTYKDDPLAEGLTMMAGVITAFNPKGNSYNKIKLVCPMKNMEQSV